MLKLSKLSDYAVITLAALEKYENSPVAASMISVETTLPEPTVAKVLKLLAGAKLVSSTRGIKGGYVLSKPLTHMNIKDVIEAIDGPIALTTCAGDHAGDCDYAGSCDLQGCWGHVNQALLDTLGTITIAQMRAKK